MKVSPQTLLWSFPAWFFFGVCNFLIGVSNIIPVDEWAVVGVLWLSCGVMGLAPAEFFRRKHGTVFFQSEQPLLDGPPHAKLSFKVKVITVLGGIFVGFSQLMMKWAFALAPAESGPLCAVISADTLVVSTFCHFVYRERMNTKQGASIVVIVLGLGVMALSSQSGGSEGSFATSLLSLLMSVFGMLSFAFCVLAIRIGCMENLAAWSGFAVRMLTVGGFGVTVFVYSACTAGWPTGAKAVEWLYPVGAGVAQAAGVFCVNMALKQPNTGIANAIFGCNSVLVLVLNIFVFHLLPNVSNSIGMALVVAGVAAISLVQDDDPTGKSCVQWSPVAHLASPVPAFRVDG